MKNGVYIYYVEDFSSELKEKIIKLLSICYIAVNTKYNQGLYTYKNTIKDSIDMSQLAFLNY